MIRHVYVDTDVLAGLQYYAALRNQCDCIVSRNVEDYKHSRIDLYTPVEFLGLYKELL